MARDGPLHPFHVDHLFEGFPCGDIFQAPTNYANKGQHLSSAAPLWLHHFIDHVIIGRMVLHTVATQFWQCMVPVWGCDWVTRMHPLG